MLSLSRNWKINLSVKSSCLFGMKSCEDHFFKKCGYLCVKFPSSVKFDECRLLLCAHCVIFAICISKVGLMTVKIILVGWRLCASIGLDWYLSKEFLHIERIFLWKETVATLEFLFASLFHYVKICCATLPIFDAQRCTFCALKQWIISCGKSRYSYTSLVNIVHLWISRYLFPIFLKELLCRLNKIWWMSVE